MKPFDAFILAAGLGTRMGNLSRALPKPAWTLNGRGLLRHLADGLKQAGFSRIACNAHLLPNRIREVAHDIQVFEEPTLLGSAGGLSHVKGFAADPLAVCNGDILADFPWEHFLHVHRTSQADLSWLLIPHPGGPWTQVYLDPENRILPLGVEGRGPYLFTGASLWSPRALSLVPAKYAEQRPILKCLERHLGVVVEPFPWREIGCPEDLLRAAEEQAPSQEGRIPSCYIHPTAWASGPGLHSCIIGPDVALPPNLKDENALWLMERGRIFRLPLYS